jgi:aryl-alcohol dehydrogenase-like predicted oxidoreductase
MSNTPMIGLGTAAIGRPQYINIQKEPKAALSLDAFRNRGLEVLEEAFQQGIRYFDTAPGYGMAERLILEWMEGKQDSHFEIATKWGYTYMANYERNPKIHELKEHSLTKLDEQWIVSKALLPRLSTYQIHSATLATGVLDNERILHRLAELKKRHNLKMGITTTGAHQAAVINKALDIEIEGIPLFDTYQCTYNVLDQSLESTFEKLQAKKKRIVIKEALANGRVFTNGDYPHYQEHYAVLDQLAGKYGVGSDAVALRFCMDSIKPFVVLSGAATPLHVRENAKALSFQLAPQEVEQLKALAIDPVFYWNERKNLSWN